MERYQMSPNEPKNRLGRGLSAIFGEDVESVLDEIQRGEHEELHQGSSVISLDKIRVNPYQPRREFDQSKLKELSESIKLHGLFTPILVRQSVSGYELIAGERRFRASKLAGLDSINAIIVDFNDEQMMEISLIENIQREDLNVIEEAMAYQQMIEKFDYTQQQISTKVSKSRAHVANLLRLLKLPAEVIQMVADNKLSMGHVRPLATFEDHDLIVDIAKDILTKQLSVREVEEMVKKRKRPHRIEIPRKPDTTYNYPMELMSKKLATPIDITKNKITIHFEDDDDLNRLLEIMGVLEDI